jgi:hypothetical protein
MKSRFQKSTALLEKRRSFLFSSAAALVGISGLSASLPAFAQQANALNALVSGAEGPLKKRWSLFAMSNLSSSLHRLDDPNHAASADLWLIPSFKLSRKFTLMATLAVSKDLKGEQRTLLNRTDLGLLWGGTRLNPFMHLTVGSGLRLPFSTDIRARDSLLTGARLAPRLNLNFSRLGLETVSAFVETSGTLNFHEFQTATSGRPNNRFVLGQTASATWAPGEVFSSTTTFGWSNAWTYMGFRNTTFQLDQQFGFQMTPQLGIALGVGNSGSPLRPNGTESAVSLIDPENSQAYCTVSLIL